MLIIVYSSLKVKEQEIRDGGQKDLYNALLLIIIMMSNYPIILGIKCINFSSNKFRISNNLPFLNQWKNETKNKTQSNLKRQDSWAQEIAQKKRQKKKKATSVENDGSLRKKRQTAKIVNRQVKGIGNDKKL